MFIDDDIQKFKVIVNFISDLHEIFGETNDSSKCAHFIRKNH